MKLRMALSGLVTVIVIFWGAVVPLKAQTTDQNYGFVQFAHAGTDAPAVDIYVKDSQTPLVSNLAYGQVTSYVALPTTASGFTVREAGTGTQGAVLYDAPFGAKSNTSLLIVVVGLQSDKSFSLEPFTIVRTNPKGKALVRIFNAVKGGPLLTLKDDKDMLAVQPSKFLTVGDSQLAPGTYNFNLVTGSNNQSIASLPNITIAADKVYTFLLIGDKGATSSAKVLVVVSPEDMTRVSISNASTGAIDIYANGIDKPIATNLAVGAKSDLITVPSGDGLFTAYTAGSPAQSTPLATISTRLRPGHDIVVAYDGSKQMKLTSDTVSSDLTSNPTLIDTTGAAQATAAATMMATSPTMTSTMTSTMAAQ